MNRSLLVFLGLLTSLLAGCEIIVQPGPAPVTPSLSLTEFVTYTNYRGQSSGVSYICDNRSTALTYRFRYEGGIERWTSYLEGQTLGQIKATRTFDPRSQGVSPYEDSGFEVVYVMEPLYAPYKQDSETSENPETLTPQDIDVVPVPQPVIIGATKLHLTLEGINGDTQSLTSEAIPVVSNCP